MKKKGFTLIELLAVIVILAIIALIATPIVMNVIENSRKGAAERSAENYLDAVEIAIASERLNGPVADGEYEIISDGSLCKGTIFGTTCEGTKLTVEINGDKPEPGGKIIIENGQVVDKLTGDTTKKTTMTIGDYIANYNEEGKIEVSKNKISSNTPVTVYRWSEETVEIGADLSSFTYVENLSDLDKDVYLKHTVKNNKVTESYVCARFNNIETGACVRGGVDDDGNSYFNENLLIKKDLQDKDLICDSYGGFGCNDGFINLSAELDGYVLAYEYEANVACFVLDNGSSLCQ